MPKRVASHRRNGRPFDQVFYLITKADQRALLEAILIRTVKPVQNKRVPIRNTAMLTEIGDIVSADDAGAINERTEERP